MMDPLLSISNLSVNFKTERGNVQALDGVSLEVNEGETLAIVGESGSGKSVTALSVLGLLGDSGGVSGGDIEFAGESLVNASDERRREIRGNQIAMIFQEPMSSLNPVLTIGKQVAEPIWQHRNKSWKDAICEAGKLLELVSIPDAQERLGDYPHQFSGGMRQRVMIAMALITEPKLLICDEPTTALDVTIQAQILELIKKLQVTRNVAVIFISHDLGVVAGIADKVLVMCNGTVRETGDTDSIFYNTQNDYTKKLLSAIPEGAKTLPNRANTDETLVEVTDLKTYFKNQLNPSKDEDKRFIKAVDGISLSIARGEILGLVGESGSGKSTLGRTILQLAPTTEGSVKFSGEVLTGLTPNQLVPWRRKMQMIFQDPYASLNPRMTVFETLSEPLLYHGLANKNNIASHVRQLMDDVGLAQSQLRKYPHEFSGGQRQRIAIGRAIATKPEFIIADEPVSALDVTIQAQILDLILNLVEKHNLTMMFISHDLSVVRYISDRVVIMNKGVIVEQGDTEVLWGSPQQAYTKDLLAAIPLADPKSERARISNR